MLDDHTDPASQLKAGSLPRMEAGCAALLANPSGVWRTIAHKLGLPPEVDKYMAEHRLVRLSTFPRRETRRAFLAIHKARNKFVVAMGKRAAQMLDEEVPMPEVVDYLLEKSKLILDSGRENYPVHPELAISIPIELALQGLWLALKRSQVTRTVAFCDTSLRDGPQSEIGRNYPLKLSERVFEAMLRDPNCPQVFQTGGGATVQFGLLESLVGHAKQSPFERHRRLMAVHRKVFCELWQEAFSEEVPQNILNRFLPGPRRWIHSDTSLSGMMTMCGHDPNSKEGRHLRRLYQVRQVALTRGEFGVAMVPQNPVLLEAFLRQMQESGLDIAQVFDWRNFEPNILLGCRAAIKADLEIIPQIHPDPRSALGVTGLKNITRKILAGLGGDHSKIFAWGVKDAPGIVDHHLAHEVAVMLEETLPSGMPVQFHSHDTSGMSMLSYAAFCMGLGKHRTVIIDGNVGETQRAQADLRSMARIFGDGGWAVKPCLSTLQGVSDSIASHIAELRQKGIVSQPMTAERRMQLIAAGMAGGASESLRRDFSGYVSGFMKKFQLSEGSQEKLLNALMEQVLLKMPVVDEALGVPCKVTPGMNWIGAMTLMVIVQEIQADCFTWEGGTLKRVSELPMEQWMLTPPLENHLWEVLQLAELRERFPAKEALLKRANDSLWSKFQSLAGLKTPSQASGALSLLAKNLGRPCIDRTTLEVAEALGCGSWMEVASATTAQETIAKVVEATGKSLFMSMDELKGKYMEEGMSWETFLIRAAFEQLGENFYDSIGHCLGILRNPSSKADDVAAAHKALAEMGVHIDA